MILKAMKYTKTFGKASKMGSGSSLSLNWWVVIAVAVYFYIKGKSSGGWFNWFGGSDDDEPKNESIPDSVFDSSDVDIDSFTITEDQAIQYALDLEFAFNYPTGTDLAVIDSILSSVNSNDWGLIDEKFGVRDYFLTGSNPLFGSPLSLRNWIREEIGQTEQVYINIARKYQDIGIKL